MVAWGDLNEYLEYDKDAKGMYCRACREAKMDSVLLLHRILVTLIVVH